MKTISKALLVLSLIGGQALAADAGGKPAKNTASAAKSLAPAANKPAKPAKAGAAAEVDVKEGLDIIGSQDAPLELNIVPWKDKENTLPKNTLEASVLNESIDPVDRDVVRREVDFSRALQALPTTSP
ncbi:MAG TPA: hypothetical protein VFW49_07870 [Fluviicoccus sp.]|nr:hypothetical protein [Fluviicoccus sp.]